MTTKEVAGQLVKMCRDGKVEAAKKELFTEDTLSLEPGGIAKGQNPAAVYATPPLTKAYMIPGTD